MEIKLGDKFEDEYGCVYELTKDDKYEFCFRLNDIKDDRHWNIYKTLEDANIYINDNIKMGLLKPIKPITDYDKMLEIKELLKELEVPQDKIDRMIEVFCEGTHIHVINYNSNHKWNSVFPTNPFNHTFEVPCSNQYVTKSEVEEMINNALIINNTLNNK